VTSKGEVHMAGGIIFNSINVNGQETNTGVFVGENAANNWESHNKNQAAIGFVFGTYLTFPYNHNLVSDNDVIDTPITEYEHEVSNTAQ
jgi:hypothetical protein